MFTRPRDGFRDVSLKHIFNIPLTCSSSLGIETLSSRNLVYHRVVIKLLAAQLFLQCTITDNDNGGVFQPRCFIEQLDVGLQMTQVDISRRKHYIEQNSLITGLWFYLSSLRLVCHINLHDHDLQLICSLTYDQRKHFRRPQKQIQYLWLMEDVEDIIAPIPVNKASVSDQISYRILKSIMSIVSFLDHLLY